MIKVIKNGVFQEMIIFVQMSAVFVRLVERVVPGGDTLTLPHRPKALGVKLVNYDCS